jgi:hypothetical protein
MQDIKTRKFKSLESYVTYSMHLGLSGLVKRVNKINHFTPDTLRYWVLSQPKAQDIWENFKASGWDTKQSPCLDRIKPDSDFGPDTCQLITNWQSKLKHAIMPHEIYNVSCGHRGVTYREDAPNKNKKYLVSMPTAGGKLFKMSTKWFSTLEEAIKYRASYERKLLNFFDINGIKY